MSLPVALAIAGLGGAALCATIALGAQLYQGSNSVWGAMKCLARGRHDPARDTATGAFRCAVCGLPGADMGDYDMAGAPQVGGYVAPMRTTYEREHGQITREEWRR